MCCIGVSAAISLSTAMGAAFLTRDSTLRPLLAAALTMTVVGSALTYWRRRRAGPLALTVLAAVWVYGAIYVAGGAHTDAHMADHMADHAGSRQVSFSNGRLAAVWLGLIALVGAQAYDLITSRRLQRSSGTGL